MPGPMFAYLQSGVENTTEYIYYNEVFKFNRTDQPVNSSLCYISSLEVYRGRWHVIEISHQGFSLSDDGSMEVCDVPAYTKIVIYPQIVIDCYR